MELENPQGIAPIPSSHQELPNWVVTLLLIIAYPIGLLIMWIFSPWSKKVKLAITLTPILLLIVLWLLLTSSLNRSQDQIKQQGGIPSQQNINVNAEDKEKSIYTNSNLGYSISYPKSWSVSESRYDNQYKTQLVVLAPPDHIPATQGIRIDINNETNLNFKNLDDYINSIHFYTPVASKQDLIINGNIAKQLVFSDGGIITYVYSSGNIFSISYILESTTERDYVSSYQDIVRTFKLNNQESKIEQNLKGTLLIYDPSSTTSEIHNKGFQPLTWYLVPRNISWPGSTSLNVELAINDDSVCYKPKDQFSAAIEFNCKELKIRWGYGDRVRIWGSKSKNLVSVSRMEIVSSLPIDEW